MLAMWILVALIVVLFIAVIVIYNGLVQARNMAQEGWSGIAVQLERRADLIPNLVAAVKGYAAHEKDLFEDVAALRAKATQAEGPDARGQAEGRLSAALGKMMLVAENYPDLKASQNFQQLQKDLTGTEDQIQLARRYYNGTVRDLNIKVQSFPNNLLAGAFGFQQMHFFELENPADRNVPEVSAP